RTRFTPLRTRRRPTHAPPFPYTPLFRSHVHGVRSAAYADSLRRADDAVGRVRRAVPDGARLIVTADHGVTDAGGHAGVEPDVVTDRKSTRLNSSHVKISYAVFCLKKQR